MSNRKGLESLQELLGRPVSRGELTQRKANSFFTELLEHRGNVSAAAAHVGWTKADVVRFDRESEWFHDRMVLTQEALIDEVEAGAKEMAERNPILAQFFLERLRPQVYRAKEVGRDVSDEDLRQLSDEELRKLQERCSNQRTKRLC